jgi:hypothetical protein
MTFSGPTELKKRHNSIYFPLKTIDLKCPKYSGGTALMTDSPPLPTRASLFFIFSSNQNIYNVIRKFKCK